MKVYVLGLGHIGLPLAVFLGLKGFEVVGIDKDKELIREITENKVNIYEKYGERHIGDLAQQLIKEGIFKVSDLLIRDDLSPGVFLVTVGISDSGEGKYDLSPLQEVTDLLASKLVEGDIVIFKTTMIPGTFEKLILPRLNALGFKVYLAYCPETIAEGAAFLELQNNPRILAAADDISYEKAAEFLRSVSDSPIYRASNIRTAEAVKVVQNVFRDVNIALINELTYIAGSLNIDIYELRYLANTHPRVFLHEPGPGVGGYCLPNALGYLRESLPEEEKRCLRLSSLARKINKERPGEVVKFVTEALQKAGKEIKGAKIAIIGLAMKDYCADVRCSPAADIADILLRLGAEVRGYDPLVPQIYVYQVATFEECIKGADCMIIAAKQENMNFNSEDIVNLMNEPPVVVDTRRDFPEIPGIKVYRI
ncbi:nucleotide sugar dehydrogenase [Thermosyntropha sp.]|uniref:nucleotide sugar dehydrogenase n=1 Tax=Thermosyntropha sp. TaxID=2740820 RepID=UPI0025EEB788|nr:nucleotide sugar dehydrogenase [Thermosyntropha sp.]MBO8159921.1 nucleotide sugar dehydrogenase [Thermosyntropha sp.]